MAYCMYLRKSRTDLEAEARGEGETLLRHEKHLLKTAQKNNIKVTKTFREVVSGETIEARPEMQNLLKEVAQGKWTGVLVMEIERLARGDTIDQGVVARAFKMSDTLIITPSKIYDPSNEFDEEYFEFGLFMSRREYKTTTRRLQRGRIASVKEGKYIASVPPYGYDKVKITNDKGYTLKANTEQAPVIEMIFKWYTEGALQEDGSKEKLGATRIANKLNDMGLKSATNSEWSRSSITDILKNPVYIGKIRWGYKKEEKFLVNGKLRKARKRGSEDYIFVDGLHEPIIDEVTFNKAKKIISKRGHAPVPGSKILKNPLTGLIFCGKCGHRMTRLGESKKNPYSTITCPNRKCDTVSAPIYLVEEAVIESLNKWLEKFKIEWKAERLDTPYDTIISNKKNTIEQLESSFDKLLEQKERIHDLLEQGVYTVDIFKSRDNKIANEIKILESTIKKNKKELSKLSKQAEYNDVFIPRAENILDTYYDMDSASARNQALKEILERIEYTKDEPNKKGDRDNKNFTLELSPKVVKF